MLDQSQATKSQAACCRWLPAAIYYSMQLGEIEMIFYINYRFNYFPILSFGFDKILRNANATARRYIIDFEQARKKKCVGNKKNWRWDLVFNREEGQLGTFSTNQKKKFEIRNTYSFNCCSPLRWMWCARVKSILSLILRRKYFGEHWVKNYLNIKINESIFCS